MAVFESCGKRSISIVDRQLVGKYGLAKAINTPKSCSAIGCVDVVDSSTVASEKCKYLSNARYAMKRAENMSVNGIRSFNISLAISGSSTYARIWESVEMFLYRSLSGCWEDECNDGSNHSSKNLKRNEKARRTIDIEYRSDFKQMSIEVKNSSMDV